MSSKLDVNIFLYFASFVAIYLVLASAAEFAAFALWLPSLIMPIAAIRNAIYRIYWYLFGLIIARTTGEDIDEAKLKEDWMPTWKGLWVMCCMYVAGTFIQICCQAVWQGWNEEEEADRRRRGIRQNRRRRGEMNVD